MVILHMQHKPAVMLVCGYKNTGKTWLMKYLIHTFSMKGYRVASIKHDGHEFDSEGKDRDSDQHYEAGAYASAVFSKKRWALIQDEALTLEDMLYKFHDADVIFVEGCKESDLPKIECLRKGYQEQSMKNLKKRFAIVADFPFEGNHVFQMNHLQPLIHQLQIYIDEVRYA